MSAFDEAWTVLKALPFKKPGGGLPFKQSGPMAGLPIRKPGDKWIPGTPDRASVAEKWLPNQPQQSPLKNRSSDFPPQLPPRLQRPQRTDLQQLQQGNNLPLLPPQPQPQNPNPNATQAGTVAVTPTPTPAAGTGLPLEDWWKNHPQNPATKVNNNPPFGPEGGQ